MKKITSLKIVMYILIIFTLLGINLIIIIKRIDIASQENHNYQFQNITQNSQAKNVVTDEKSKETQEIEKLKEMNERARMEYYFSKFISYIKEEDYSKAYNLLYPEFRNQYFKTEDEFKSYVKKTYPKAVGFSYKDIQRQGYIYVLIIDIVDPSKKIGEEKSQRIVIKENDFNDFVLSFQVI